MQLTEGWPTKSCGRVEFPTSFLLVAGGYSKVASGGAWNVEAGGVIRLADIVEGGPLSPGVLLALHGSARATNLSVGEVRFGECVASGGMRGDAFEGEVVTRAPDSRLAWSVALREPFGFRLEGPFSLGDPGNGTVKSGSRRFSLRGARARALSARWRRPLGPPRGSAPIGNGVRPLVEDLSAPSGPTGIRWSAERSSLRETPSGSPGTFPGAERWMSA